MFARRTEAQASQTEPKRKPKPKGNTWFPSTKTATGAAEAAKQSAYAYFGLTFGYLLADALIVLFRFNPLKIDTSPAVLGVNLATAAVAALIGWMALRKPGLIKSGVVLAWVVLEFVMKVEMLKSANVGVYWLNICMTLWAVNGVRGVLALRKPDREAVVAAF